jgi:hypothetical protein
MKQRRVFLGEPEPEPALSEFSPGSLVYSKVFRGPRGLVKGRTRDGRIIVLWQDLDYTAQHWPNSLILGESADVDEEDE